jgi:hypothetical protein
LATRELVTEWVPVPKWGGKVLVRELTGTERDAFEASIVTQKGKQRTTNTENIRAKLAQLAIVDPTDPKKRRATVHPETGRPARQARRRVARPHL